MNSDRIRQLKQFILEDPKDPFNRYALALELTRSDRQKAKEVFDYLLEHNPDYVPTYYQAAQLYIEMNYHSEAVAIIESGMILAKKKNELKVRGELQGLLESLD
jgi:predicted Zn-dependent protease